MQTYRADTARSGYMYIETFSSLWLTILTRTKMRTLVSPMRYLPSETRTMGNCEGHVHFSTKSLTCNTNTKLTLYTIDVCVCVCGGKGVSCNATQGLTPQGIA